METVKQWHQAAVGQRVVAALQKNDFDARYVATLAEAADFIMAQVSPGMKVGFGGSMTIKDMGIQDKVQAAGGTVLDHGTPGLTREERVAVAREELLSDLYLCSSNAVTLDGRLVNIDGMGNRVSALSFGPEKVIVVLGINKVCQDEAAAFERLETIASPMNNKRLDIPNPCTKTGVCMDCQGPTRICRVYSVIRRKPVATDMTVLIVGENGGY